MSADLFSRHLTPHVKKLEAAGLLSGGPSPFRSLETRMFIACSSRTGSTLLCDMLRRHGVNGKEYLNPKPVIRDGASLSDYLARITQEANGRFCTKGAFNALAPLVMIGELPEYVHSWKFVFLTRRDLVRQAVSNLIANLSGTWVLYDPPIREVRDADYDSAKIADMIEQIQEINDHWEQFFSVMELDPIRLCYEDLASDPPGVAARLAATLGLPEADTTIQGRIESQSTYINVQWAERFRAEAMAFRPLSH